MRIVFIYPGDVTGADLNHVPGSGRLIDLASVAAAGGADVMVIGLTDGPTRDIWLRAGLTARVFNVRTSGATGVQRFLRSGSDLLPEMGTYLLSRRIDALFIYGTSLKHAKPLHDFGRQHGITLIAGVNEWGHKTGQSLVSYTLLRMGIGYVARRYDKVIAISELMMDFFARFPRLQLLKIPSIFDISELPDVEPGHWSRDGLRGKVVLAYAGSVGHGKDAINNVIRGLSLLTESERDRFVFWLAGSSRDSIVASLGEDAEETLARTQHILDFKGFLPRAEVQKLLSNADYTVLLRPDEPYANAGFPTKFGESMVLGVPVIANLTSDLGHYLHDGVEGYVVDDDSPEAAAATLRRVLATHQYPNEPMRLAALRTGRRSFDLRAYADDMATFLTAP